MTKWEVAKGRTRDLVISGRGEVIPYREIEQELGKGEIIFVEEPMKKQTIHQAAERMSKRLGFKVLCRRASLKNRVGYALFSEMVGKEAFTSGGVGEEKEAS